ncbi:MAG: lytic transglycosylase domain-containing protein [Acidobacteriota bacterium]
MSGQSMHPIRFGGVAPAVASVAMLVASHAFADVYKFTGVNGVVTYTNTPGRGVRVPVTSGIWGYTPRYASRIAPEKRKEYAAIAERVATKYDVDPGLVKAVIAVESGFDPKAVSPKGAQGLMQLMPFTAERFEVADVFDPEQNIEGGVKYLHFLHEMFDGNLIFVVAAYNAGENIVDKLKAIPPYAETEEYVRRVLSIKDDKEPEISDKLYRKSLFTFIDENGLTHVTDRRPSGVKVQAVRP